MSEIYLADRECKVNASEALQEIDKQYLGWGWNTEQTTLDLVDYAKALERQLAEAREGKNYLKDIIFDSLREINNLNRLLSYDNEPVDSVLFMYKEEIEILILEDFVEYKKINNLYTGKFDDFKKDVKNL